MAFSQLLMLLPLELIAESDLRIFNQVRTVRTQKSELRKPKNLLMLKDAEGKTENQRHDIYSSRTPKNKKIHTAAKE